MQCDGSPVCTCQNYGCSCTAHLRFWMEDWGLPYAFPRPVASRHCQSKAEQEGVHDNSMYCKGSTFLIKKTSKKRVETSNGKILWIKKGHIGIVEKEQETRDSIGVCLYATLYGRCILECRDKPTSHCVTNSYTHGNNLIPISVPPYLQLLFKVGISNYTVITVLHKYDIIMH